MPKVSVSVSVDDEHLDRFADVVEACKKAGLSVEQRLDAIGVMTGSIDSAKVEQLHKVKGVADVEGARRFQLAPPESDIQ
jgi:hypothetical protein